MPTPGSHAKRISRACLRCRQRKSKCNLDSYGVAGKPPCQRCVDDGANCVLGGSNRGGRRRPIIRQTVETASAAHSTPTKKSYPAISNVNVLEQQNNGLALSSNSFDEQTNVGRSSTQTRNMAAAIEDTFASTNLHNTSDALNFLSQAAENAAAAQRSDLLQSDLIRNAEFQTPIHPELQNMSQRNPEVQYSRSHDLPYHLVTMGLLTDDQVAELVSRFAKLYHPYLPIAPRKSLQIACLHDTARNEAHLLTAMITVAAKDLPSGTAVLEVTTKYMNQLVAEISAGKRVDVEAVEALLLLAEWEPQCSLSSNKEIGCGEEDLAAWMHVGLALRIAYYLRLERTSFRNDDEERMLHYHRRRLAWAACYICDRQISVRAGRAFWSRGPGPVSGNGRHEFPTLQPESLDDEDYASILQANLELTQLFTNVHDVLYSGMGSSMKMMLVGNYVKYIDDFRAAINSWKSVWGILTCSSNLKISLQMTFEYLRLYTNAYAFQATTFRTISSIGRDPQGQTGSTLGHVGSLPDARFIWESVDAAKSLLTLVNNYTDPETCLRHFPMRFTLYCVNSAVFLYKAWSFRILNDQEKTGVRRMISATISRLRAGSVRPSDFGPRYAQLLELLWQQTDTAPQEVSSALPLPDPGLGIPSQRRESPHDDFSWLDLQAVGEFITGEQEPDTLDFTADSAQQYIQASRRGSNIWNDMGWAEDTDMNRFF